MSNEHSICFPDSLTTTLTKREYFAAMAMQGILSDRLTLDRIDEISREDRCRPSDILARLAIIHADSLIERLNKQP